MKKEDFIAELEKLPAGTEVFLLDVSKELSNHIDDIHSQEEMVQAGDGLISEFEILDCTTQPLQNQVTGEMVPWVAIVFNADPCCDGNCMDCDQFPNKN